MDGLEMMLCDLPRLCYKRWCVFCTACWSTQTSWLEPLHRKSQYHVTSVLCGRPDHVERPDVVHMDSGEVPAVSHTSHLIYPWKWLQMIPGLHHPITPSCQVFPRWGSRNCGTEIRDSHSFLSKFIILKAINMIKLSFKVAKF